MAAITVLSSAGRIRIAIFLLAFVPAFPTFASDVQALLQTPAWKVDYEVVFDSDTSRSPPQEVGTMTVRTVAHLDFKASKLLDMRSDGSALGSLRMQMAMQSGEGATVDPMKYAEQMMEEFTIKANWMNSGSDWQEVSEDASYEEAANAGMASLREQEVPIHIAYEEVRTGRGVPNEMGNLYDFDGRTVADGTAAVVPGSGSFNDVIFELDARAGRYILVVPFFVTNPDLHRLPIASRTVVSFPGETPIESEESRDTDYSTFMQIDIVNPAYRLGTLPVIEGDIGSGGVIRGEHTIKAEYQDGTERLPGTVVLRFTATPVGQ